jgi:hypothetical protein
MRVETVCIWVLVAASVVAGQKSNEQLIRRSRDARLELAPGRAVAAGRSEWCLVREVAADGARTVLYASSAGARWQRVGELATGDVTAYLAADGSDDAVHVLWHGNGPAVRYAVWTRGGASEDPAELAAGEGWQAADLIVSPAGVVAAGLVATSGEGAPACGVRLRVPGAAAFAPLLRVDDGGATALSLAAGGWTLHALYRGSASPPLLFYRAIDLSTQQFRAAAIAVAPPHGSALAAGPEALLVDAVGRPRVLYAAAAEGGRLTLRHAADRGGPTWTDAIASEPLSAPVFAANAAAIVFASADDEYRTLRWRDFENAQPAQTLASSPLPKRYAGIQTAPEGGTVLAAFATTGAVTELVATPLPAGGRAIGVARGAPRLGRDGTAAIAKALAWLARHQDGNGRWDPIAFGKHDTEGTPSDGPGKPYHDIGISALALRALIAGGHDGVRGAHAESVRRGLVWLASKQQQSGLIRDEAVYPHAYIYDHAIAASALFEACASSGETSLRPAAGRALAYLHAHRNPYSVWRYEPRNGENDISVTTWCVAALIAARDAGFDVEPEALKYAAQFVDELTDPLTGHCGYTGRGELSARLAGDHEVRFPREHGEAMTAAGLWIRCLLGQTPQRVAVMNNAAATILAKPPAWDVASGRIDLYYWYHATLALRDIGGASWANWSKALLPALVKTQRVDGNFAGSWDPVGVWGEVGGRVYATAMAALCLLAGAERR